MSIEYKKMGPNCNQKLKCDNCKQNIDLGKFLYLSKNKTPNIPQLDNLGFIICEDCYNKGF